MLGLHQRTRTVYLTTRQDREEERKAEEAEFADVVVPAIPEPSKPEAEPEYDSVEAFAEFLMDDDRESFTFEELQRLHEGLLIAPSKIIKELASYGLKYEGRPKEREVRGFTSNSHNLYAGNPMCGGSGFDPNGVGSRRGR